MNKLLNASVFLFFVFFKWCPRDRSTCLIVEFTVRNILAFLVSSNIGSIVGVEGAEPLWSDEETDDDDDDDIRKSLGGLCR